MHVLVESLKKFCVKLTSCVQAHVLGSEILILLTSDRQVMCYFSCAQYMDISRYALYSMQAITRA